MHIRFISSDVGDGISVEKNVETFEVMELNVVGATSWVYFGGLHYHQCIGLSRCYDIPAATPDDCAPPSKKLVLHAYQIHFFRSW
jgi:hypothetical protein